jgi:uncharacterized protein with HEPN domain
MSDEARSRYSEVTWQDLIGLPTVLAHHYQRGDPNQVWTITTVEVPRLVEHLGST